MLRYEMKSKMFIFFLHTIELNKGIMCFEIFLRYFMMFLNDKYERKNRV